MTGPRPAAGRSSGLVNSIVRSLAVLERLNAHNGASISQVAEMTGLPRGTAFRIVETLRVNGYVARHARTNSFVLTDKVKRLSEGFISQDWVYDLARPLIAQLARKAVWPVSLSTPRRYSLVMRLSSDLESPLTETRYPVGTLLPLLATASGHAFLAFCAPAVREAMIEVCMNEATGPLRGTQLQLRRFKAAEDAIRAKGYAYFTGYTHTQGLKRTAAIAVPVCVKDSVRGCLSMRFFASALGRDDLERTFVPLFQEAAASLATEIN
ncbi:MAG: helix-turn-helix domain-containing protein [Rhodospirillaceae bacterium]|nr:helix-turn-helix domain-containing protein [Rhodospirillaceae bacterium]